MSRREEDELCRLNGCCGRLEIASYECKCGIERAPCTACESATLWCPDCGWIDGEDNESNS